MKFFVAIMLVLTWGLVNGQDTKEYFFGTWQPNNGTTHEWDWVLTSFDDWSKYHKEKFDEGLRLVDFEHYNSNGQDYFFGTWHPGSGAQWTFVFTTFDEWGKRNTEYFNQGLRLVDFEHYNINGQDYFFGTWRPGSGAQWDWVHISFDDWGNTNIAKFNEGLRLVDFEHYNINGQDYYFGSWQAGSGTQWTWVFGTFDEWGQRNTEYFNQGLRLVDFEYYNVNGQDLFFGNWQPNKGIKAQWDWLHTTFDDWGQTNVTKFNQGLSIMDFEHLKITNDVNFDYLDWTMIGENAKQIVTEGSHSSTFHRKVFISIHLLGELPHPLFPLQKHWELLFS